MINENYSYCRDKTLSLSKLMNISQEEIEDFYLSSSSTLKSNLETALNRLERKALLYWTYAITVCLIDTRIETTETGLVKAVKREYTTESGEVQTDYDSKKATTNMIYREATENEIRIIKEVEHDLLVKYDCEDDFSKLFKIGKAESFFKEVKDILFDKTNIVYYYKSYDIIFSERHIKRKLKKMKLHDSKREFTQGFLNAAIMDRISENAKNRHEKALDQTIFDDKPKKKVLIRSSHSYIDNNESLSNTLINSDFKSLKGKLN